MTSKPAKQLQVSLKLRRNDLFIHPLREINNGEIQQAIHKAYADIVERTVGVGPARDSSGEEVPIFGLAEVLKTYSHSSTTSRYFMEAETSLKLIYEKDVSLVWLVSAFEASVAVVCKRVESIHGNAVWAETLQDDRGSPSMPFKVNGQIANSGRTGTLEFRWDNSDTLRYHYEEFLG